MSSTSICTICLRAARHSATSTRTLPPRLLRNYSSQASYVFPATSPRPLYLDFLAPSSSTTKHFQFSRSRLSIPFSQRRTISSATPPPATPARAIRNPRTDESGNPMLISVTPRASARLKHVSGNDENLALQITVESGGCHGFQYLMNLINLSEKPETKEDTVFEAETGAKVVIDESSLELLKGSTVDYTRELIGSQFIVTGIPGATSSCGCGTSFDIKFD